MDDEILEPKEICHGIFTEDDYDNMINDTYGMIEIGNIRFLPAYVLHELDPIAYDCRFDDYQEYETKWECPICGELLDYEDDAKWCCQKEGEEE